MKESVLKIYSDGGARGNPGPAACAFVAVKGGKILDYRTKFLGNTTNNVAEYEGVILALEWLKENKRFLTGKTFFFLDSELVARQLRGTYKIKNKRLNLLALKVADLLGSLKERVYFKQIPRTKNVIADTLVNKTLSKALKVSHLNTSA